MERIINKLKMGRNRPSTWKNYYSVWRTFNEFFIRLYDKPDTWEERLTLFVGYLAETNKKSTMIKSYISAIKAVLPDDGVEINKDRYLLTSLTKACKYKNNKVRTRLPIQRGMLRVLCDKLDLIFGIRDQQLYLRALYKALFMSAYYGLLRVGEMMSGMHPVRAKDVKIADNKNKVLFVLRTSKTHWTDSKPQLIKISGSGSRLQEYCPFNLLRNFLSLRRKYEDNAEPFFIFSDRSPVTPDHMRRVMRLTVELCNLDPKLYSVHSFRIGRIR